MRLIDADRFLIEESEGYISAQSKIDENNWLLKVVNEATHKKVQMLIADAPTVDAEPISHGEWIRCRDCKHYGAKTVAYIVETGERLAVCDKHPYGAPANNPDWFCADGESRQS